MALTPEVLRSYHTFRTSVFFLFDGGQRDSATFSVFLAGSRSHPDWRTIYSLL